MCSESQMGLKAGLSGILLGFLIVAALGYPGLLSAQSESALTPDLVDNRLGVLEQDGSAADSEEVKLYQEIRDLLLQEQSFDRKASEYVEDMTNAPLRAAEIQARIDSLEEAPQATAGLDNLPRDELEAKLVVARSDLNEANSNLAGLDRQLAARESNASEARLRLTEIQESIESLPGPQLSLNPAAKPSVSEGRAWRDAATFRMLGAERRALNARLDSQPARFSAFALQRAELDLAVQRMSKHVGELEALLQNTVAAVMDARAMGIEPDDPVYELANELAAMDAELREEKITINTELADTRAQVGEIESNSRTLEKRFATARRVVSFAADTDVLGSILLAYWGEIEGLKIDKPTADLSRKAGSAVVHRIEQEESLEELSSARAYINRRLVDAGIDSENISNRSLNALLDLVTAYRDRLRDTITTESDYIDSLGALDDGYTSLKRQIGEYESYLRGLILWNPAFPPLWEAAGDSVSAEFATLTSYKGTINISANPILVLCLILGIYLFLRRFRLAEHQKVLNSRTTRPRDDDILHTVFALGCVALRALPMPLFLAGLGFAVAPDSLSAVIENTAVVLFFLQAIKITCETSGLGEVHFHWSEKFTVGIYREARRLIYFWLPLALVTGAITRPITDVGDAVVARCAFIILAMLALFLIASSLLRAVRDNSVSWYRDNGSRVRLLLVIVLLVIIVALLLGNVYAVTMLFGSVIETLWLGTLLLLLQAVLMRWVSVTRRHLRLTELMAAREAAEGVEEGIIEEPVATLSDVSAETAQFINVGIFAAAAVCLFYIWAPLLPAFDLFENMTLWTSSVTSEGGTVVNKVSLATLIAVVVLIGLTIYAARKLPALIDLALRSKTGVSASARYTVSTLLNYVIVGGGIIAGFSALGMQWSQLQWLVAALGVGIGFGLQEIIANFISGLIILFERPIRIGDVVSTGDKDGVVTRIRIRATTIRDWDGKELLVPNKEFITGRLLNWSLSDPKIRTVLPVGVAYGSDIELTIKTLYDIVSQHPRVVDEPEPQVVFESFGDNALMLSGRCYLDSLENRLGVVTEMNREIYKRFAELGIEIAFPQRDVHLDTERPLRIELESRSREDESH